MFGKRRQRKKILKQMRAAQLAVDLWKNVPTRFVDDGCTYSPDSLMRTDISWICRIHDWRYCSRTNAPDEASPKHRRLADKELRFNMGLNLPWYVKWTRNIYYFFIRRFGNGDHSYNTCGISVGEVCRHNMPVPLWMERKAMS